MEVILMERIEKLGQMGDIVKVKAGYARNYLLPHKKAMRATDENRRYFEDKRAQLEADNLERRGDAEAVGKKLDGVSVTLIRQAGDAGQLYGSVNVRDIAKVVSDAGFTVDRRQISLEHPIKAIGLYEVKVILHPEVTVSIFVNVARSKDEAKIQAKTGKAVVDAEEAGDKPDKPTVEADETAPEIAELLEEEVEIPEEISESGDDGKEENAADEGKSRPGDKAPEASGDSGGDSGDDSGGDRGKKS